MSEVVHPRERKLIDRHFAARATAAAEVTMRTHLAACAGCRGYYDRHTLLATLDPRAARAKQRLAAGLGFARPRVRRTPFPGALLLAPAAAAMLIALVFLARRPTPDAGFTPRHSGTPLGPRLYAYRVAQDRPIPLGETMRTTDELAFAYDNPTGLPRLLVVGVDEQSKLYWYHPNPDVSDVALPIAVERSQRELPEAIRHAHHAGTLRIMGIFAHDALPVGRVAALIDGTGCGGLRARLPDIECVELKVTVRSEAETEP
jgi:hypothetical protein